MENFCKYTKNFSNNMELDTSHNYLILNYRKFPCKIDTPCGSFVVGHPVKTSYFGLSTLLNLVFVITGIIKV